MPRFERSFAKAVDERAAADGSTGEAARAAVVDDLATGRLQYRCNFERGNPVWHEPLELDFDFRPVRATPSYDSNLWQQIRAGEIGGWPMTFGHDNKTITANQIRVVDIVLWDEDGTLESIAKRASRIAVHAADTKPIPAPSSPLQPADTPASPERQPGDTDKARGDLLYLAAKPHTGAWSWSAETAFAEAQKASPNNPLLAETGISTKRRAWRAAKRRKLQGKTATEPQ